MKMKALLAVAAIVGFSACETSYQATDSTTFVVPDVVRADFESQYPNVANVTWSSYDPNVVIINDWELAGWTVLDESDYAVRFNMDNEDYYAWYDSDGTWIGTAYVVRDFNTLPSPVSTTLRTQFPAYTISSVNKEFYRDRTAYEVVLKNTSDSKVILLVDNNGTVIKQKTKY
jgi:hypothetical protein